MSSSQTEGILMTLAVPITGLYAAIQAIIVTVLLFPIGRMRTSLGVSLNDGGNATLSVAIRRHANWAEHVPFALLLMGLLELDGGNAALLHGLGVALVIARIVHPLGLRMDKIATPPRIAGAAITGVVTLVAAIALLVKTIGAAL
jgi:uncharacterized protein